ncbi:hypothetical protein ASPWEDRAFT_184205 [Aspergillus wentii DTO 134E9]|uniref:Uncharacterized protein n=1 Tax=Aspergillus wentii DTO 134E9 TaxID=1073089 RepID=A0A1L9RFB9_ASPWE|nr:uncharacterized protein ASPWEDRAFT_184205 [Aspergillus wentii DTO 134E9]KAI9925385.1 hypothetical protein MW887_005766 [Aspergillus wentii]OJJ33616.1 hypothetical protein ASPWEDRAFT_184205 [Aspergillus wentii DTO 134E9]
MDQATSSQIQDLPPTKESLAPTSEKTSVFTRIKQHLHNVKKTWGPLLAAREDWQDEYNFNPGRWAGQGWEPSPRKWYAIHIPAPATID